MIDMLDTPPIPWWKRPELLLVLVVCAMAVAMRPTTLPLIGEESRRAIYAGHVLAGGDWAVMPRWEGFYDRPPGQYWQIAAAAKLTGTLNPLTVRLGSIIATILTALVIFWYGSHALSRAGAFVAAIAYPTMGQVLQIGRRAETEPLFVLLLSSSLLVWHHGYREGRRPTWTWIGGYLLMTAAAMTKGTQAPVTFIGATVVFLLLRRDWRMLFRPAHFAGAAICAGCVALWLVPFYARTSMQDVANIWFGQVKTRSTFDPGAFALHLVTFPFEVLGAMLPWSVLLVPLLNPRVRRGDVSAQSMVWFMLIAIAGIFVPVWLVTGARHRYVMPLYPLACVLVGYVVDRMQVAADEGGPRKLWLVYQRTIALVVVGAAVVFAGATLAAPFRDEPAIQTFKQPAWLAAGFLVIAAAGAIPVWRWARQMQPQPVIKCAAALAIMIAALFSGPILTAKARKAIDVSADVAALRERIGRERMVSFALVDHTFAYYWAKPINEFPWPQTRDDVPSDVTWFAFLLHPANPRPALPFAWEEIARFNMDRTHSDWPETLVVVGKRLPEP